MNLIKMISEWKDQMGELGIEINSVLLEGAVMEEELKKKSMLDLIDEIKEDVLFSVDSNKVAAFFNELFVNPNVAEQFALKYGLSVDITYLGNVEILTDEYEEDLNLEEKEAALIELIGEKKTNSIILSNIFRSKADGDIVSNAIRRIIEEKIIEHFEPVGKLVENKVRELEDKLKNLI